MSDGGASPASPPRCWLGSVEIPAADPARAARFYAAAFGWDSRETRGGEAPYLDLLPGPGSPERMAPAHVGVTTPAVLGAAHPLAVVHVEGDLAAALDRIVAAGGQVDLPATPVPDHGTFARFRDPDGNLFGLWAAAPTG